MLLTGEASFQHSAAGSPSSTGYVLRRFSEHTLLVLRETDSSINFNFGKLVKIGKEMATQEEIAAEIQELKEKIKKHEDAIENLETNRQSAKTEKMKICLGEEITAIRNEIAAIRNQITELLTSQRGKFASPIPVILSYSYQ
jgi:uncharacterized protein YicC (UPF0701 family)